jgi:hypothetical protein
VLLYFFTKILTCLKKLSIPNFMKFGSTLLELRTLSSLRLLACRLACFHPWCWHVLSVLQSITRIDFENKNYTAVISSLRPYASLLTGDSDRHATSPWRLTGLFV